jgi:hypothetical protein
MSRALAIAWAASAIFLSAGCASFGHSGQAVYLKERFGARAAQDLERASGEVRQLRDAYMAQEEPRVWTELEMSYSQAELVLRESNAFTPEISARLRQKYGEDARIVAGQIAEEKAKWSLLADKIKMGGDNIDALLLSDRIEAEEYEKLRAFQNQEALRVVQHLGVTAAEVKARREAAKATAPKPEGNEHIEEPELAEEFEPSPENPIPPPANETSEP